MIRLLAVASLGVLLAACATRPQQTASEPQVTLPAAPPPGEPTGIAGLEASQVRVAFGAPAFVRKDGHSEMWRYDAANCKAFFFLYPSGTSLSVRHVETLPRGPVMAADAGCLDLLRAKPATTPVS